MSIPNPKLKAAIASIAKNPKSKAIALRWYLKDHFGKLYNPATNELKSELTQALNKVKRRNAPTIVDICRECVGGGADGNCRDSVRNCKIINCFLFNVRPYQFKSALTLKNTMQPSFSRAIVRKVKERPILRISTSKKRTLQRLSQDYIDNERVFDGS